MPSFDRLQGVYLSLRFIGVMEKMAAENLIQKMVDRRTKGTIIS